MMKRVLIITCNFPPMSSVGALRLKGLAKNLPKFGWEPTILIPSLSSNSNSIEYHFHFRVIEAFFPGKVSDPIKERLSNSIQQNNTYRKESRLKSSFKNIIKGILIYPDEYKKWHPYAFKSASELISREKFHAIISSSYPVTTHIIASKLKLEYNMPWIADFRDLWTQNHYYKYSIFRKLIERKLECNTIMPADALVTVSKPLADKLKLLHKQEHIYAVTNGFDIDELSIQAKLTPKFTITYTGQMYKGKRDPSPLFKAVRQLINEKVLLFKDLEINFFGPDHIWLENEVKRYQLDGLVKLHGMVSREVVLKKQRESQLLLLLNWNNTQEEGVYTGKLFEYLASRRPIFAIGGPKGVVSDLLYDTGVGIQVTEYNDILDALVKYYKEYKSYGKVRYLGDHYKIQRYSHYQMANKYAAVLNSITKYYFKT